MTADETTDTRSHLLAEAARQVAASPGEEISVRAVCEAVGVKMSTLYHYYGSRQGLIDAVIAQSFQRYLDEKVSTPSSGDPIQDIRVGWDAHVAFGIANPGVYTLMFGKVRSLDPAGPPDGPTQALLRLVNAAADQGRLVVEPRQATEQILATNVGLTLREISLAQPDWELSVAVREAVLAAVTGTSAGGTRDRADSRAAVLHRTLELVATSRDVLGDEETRLLLRWVRVLASRRETG